MTFRGIGLSSFQRKRRVVSSEVLVLTPGEGEHGGVNTLVPTARHGAAARHRPATLYQGTARHGTARHGIAAWLASPLANGGAAVQRCSGANPCSQRWPCSRAWCGNYGEATAAMCARPCGSGAAHALVLCWHAGMLQASPPGRSGSERQPRGTGAGCVNDGRRQQVQLRCRQQCERADVWQLVPAGDNLHGPRTHSPPDTRHSARPTPHARHPTPGTPDTRRLARPTWHPTSLTSDARHPTHAQDSTHARHPAGLPPDALPPDTRQASRHTRHLPHTPPRLPRLGCSTPGMLGTRDAWHARHLARLACQPRRSGLPRAGTPCVSCKALVFASLKEGRRVALLNDVAARHGSTAARQHGTEAEDRSC